MAEQKVHSYPVFVMCGEDPRRRKMMAVLDPEGKYKSKALLPFLGRRLIDWQLEELRRSLYAAFGCATRGVIISDAGFGMDMDLPEDYARLEAFVRRTKLGDRVD